MIVGILLRNFKVYKSPTFIPISNGNSFCGLIGRNGIGKSSVLEALDFYFNDRPFKVNINNTSAPAEERYVVPVFLIEKSQLTDSKIIAQAESFSNAMWNVLNVEIAAPTFNSMYIDIFKSIKEHIKNIAECAKRETHYLLPIGRNYNKWTSLGIFRDQIFLDSLVEPLTDIEESASAKAARAAHKLTDLADTVKSMFQYVYIPKDIEPEKLVQFETQEIQTLLGTQLENIVARFLPKTNIDKLSQGLKAFIEELSNKIPNYIFRTPNERQKNVSPNKIYALIIQEFFSIRELHKEGTGDRGKDISIRDLSSGEKQQAILTLVHSIISEYRSDSTKFLIIAVDEPESSLHISACYDQFEKLYGLSNDCCQVLFSSHWYGFIPAMNSGTITNIVTENAGDIEKHRSHIFNIHKYREEIKHANELHSREHRQSLPIDIMLKSSNDFIQSILISTIEDNYNWLICEGSSDKIYLDAYLHDEVKHKKLRIIPVCTATEVKNTYNQLAVSFGSIEKSKLKGKVFLLTDTDSSPVEFDTYDELEKHLKCRRVVNDKVSRSTKLVKIRSNPKTPNTDIEDTLNGKIYNRTLLWYKNQGEASLSFLPDMERDEISSYYAMNLTLSDYSNVDAFFSENRGRNKIPFAEKYVELMRIGSSVPAWIQEIKEYFSHNIA